MVSFGLILLLTGRVLFGTNPRMGHPADIITFPSETRPDGAIWLSMTPIGDDIVVTTADRKVFRWKADVKSLDDLRDLRDYLKEVVQREVEAAALSGRAYLHQTTAVIAADQRLKFLHVRPLL
jgi:hypothetical protein